MSLLIMENLDNIDLWLSELNNKMPDIKTFVSNQKFNTEEIEAVLLWGKPLESLKQFPNLKVIMSVIAGVEYLLEDTDLLPEKVPIVRLVSPFLSLQVSGYVILSILRFHRQSFQYQELQNKREWQKLHFLPYQSFDIGILGIGVMGLELAKNLINLGFPVRGWGKTPKKIDGIEYFYGSDQLTDFLSKCQVLVCVLPLTNQTVNILNHQLFSSLPQGAYLINVGRGQHLVEEDLIEALNSNHLSGACLDVFRIEPLPKDHPFWTHPKIVITPHIASQIIPAQQVIAAADTIDRMRSGLPFVNVVSIQNKY